MKRKYTIAFILSSLLFMTACQNEEEIGKTEPSIRFGTGTGFIHQDTTLSVLDTFEIQVVAENGSADLKNCAFLRGEKAYTDIVGNPFVLEVNGFEAKKYTENPIILEGIDKKGFTTKWKLVAPKVAGKNTYQFFVEDTKGKEASITLIITTK